MKRTKKRKTRGKVRRSRRRKTVKDEKKKRIFIREGGWLKTRMTRSKKWRSKKQKKMKWM